MNEEVSRDMTGEADGMNLGVDSRDGVKVKEVDLYNAFIVVPHTQGAQVITQFLPANYNVPASTS